MTTWDKELAEKLGWKCFEFPNPLSPGIPDFEMAEEWFKEQQANKLGDKDA